MGIMKDPKNLFLILSSLSRIGDRMWGFAAYLLLVHAFPDNKFLLGGIYGISNALSTAIFSSWVGGWIDRKQRLPAATTLLVFQNVFVAAAAILQIGVIKWPSDWPPLDLNVQYGVIAAITFFSCIAMVASIGHGICMERDWIPQVFKGEALTSLNAWVRRIDQTAMLLGPLLASVAIDFKPWIGGLVIAAWNIISLFIELFVMRKIYDLTPSLQELKPKKSQSKTEFHKGLVDWIGAWKHWVKSPVFVPGLALAVLYSNIFQLSFLAQAYASSHCISSSALAVVWIVAGICGFSATWFYEYFIKNYGLVTCAITGAFLHFSLVLGTVGGLFMDGSMYQFHQANNELEICPISLNATILADKLEMGLLPTSEFNILTNYEVSCSPPEQFLSIFFMLTCCALSRCGLWLFDLSVSQMFQEWVHPSLRGRVSGAQNGAQYLFDCIHFGLVFLWTEQCEYGHGIILTAIIMFFGYSNFILRALFGESFKNVPKYNDDETKEETKEDFESNRTEALIS